MESILIMPEVEGSRGTGHSKSIAHREEKENSPTATLLPFVLLINRLLCSFTKLIIDSHQQHNYKTMKVSPFALLLAMSSSARGSSKSAKSLANEPDVILEENALSISLSSYPESVVVVDAEIAAKSSKSTKKRLFESKSSKSNRRNLTTKSEKGFSYGVDVTGLGLGDAMSYNVEATLPDGMGYLVDSTAPEVLLESLSYVTTVIEASSKSSKKSKLNNMVSLAKSTKAETAVSKNSGKSTKSSATDATSLIEPRSIGPANFSPVDFTRIVDVDQSDPAIEDASSGALAAAQITSTLSFLTVALLNALF
mmetsp:Transcript_11563/g.27119  ORF Transcript_11563/g.27119 Transcript_11563/m.27119 type:complete len:310 (+) Transcript_11563:2779-3708(+)